MILGLSNNINSRIPFINYEISEIIITLTANNCVSGK